jgi:hypothetical protein
MLYMNLRENNIFGTERDKTKDSIIEMESENFGLVETGEGRSLPETRYIVNWPIRFIPVCI